MATGVSLFIQTAVKVLCQNVNHTCCLHYTFEPTVKIHLATLLMSRTTFKGLELIIRNDVSPLTPDQLES